MKHRLGSLRIDEHAAHIPFARLRLNSSPQAILQALRQLDSRRHSDLLAVLADDDPDRAWVETVAATVAELRRDGRALALADCERTTDDDGQCVVMLFDRTHNAGVRPGDVLMPGVAVLRAPETGLVVMPRIFRQICSNGAVMTTETAQRRQVETCELAEAMHDCLAPMSFGQAVDNLRHAANTTVDDVGGLLRRAQPVTANALLLAEWRRAGDRSAFGLLNAATALAHGERNPARRLDREQDAQRLLDALVGAETAASLSFRG